MTKVKAALAKLRADCTANGVNLVLGFGYARLPERPFAIIVRDSCRAQTATLVRGTHASHEPHNMKFSIRRCDRATAYI